MKVRLKLVTILCNTFFNLFTAEVDTTDPNVLASVKGIVTHDMNNTLLALYSVEGVKKALFDIGDLKAP